MKKTFKFISTLSLLYLLSACGGGGGGDNGGDPPPPDTPPPPTQSEIRSNLEKATVKIRATVGDQQISGSGFFIGDEGYIVTNNHVVTGASTLDVTGFNFTGIANPIAVAECADLALIKLVEADSASYSGLDWFEGTPPVGTPIGTGGFSGNTQTSFEDANYAYFSGTINTLPQKFNSNWASVNAFFHDALGSAGNSGGSVIELETGKVVGVHFAGSTVDNNRKYAISLDAAKRNVEKMMIDEQDIL
ncbi:MAG: trypsin-like peptidase domain-containing protein, partial [Gammaproteobacteria bacterium]|nr:trypsin-like peptidase domain-containing protein [Gammaproteobacteria bacterium]